MESIHILEREGKSILGLWVSGFGSGVGTSLTADEQSALGPASSALSVSRYDADARLEHHFDPEAHRTRKRESAHDIFIGAEP